MAAIISKMTVLCFKSTLLISRIQGQIPVLMCPKWHDPHTREESAGLEEPQGCRSTKKRGGGKPKGEPTKLAQWGRSFLSDWLNADWEKHGYKKCNGEYCRITWLADLYNEQENSTHFVPGFLVWYVVHISAYILISQIIKPLVLLESMISMLLRLFNSRSSLNTVSYMPKKLISNIPF